jgi:hypothetical protein
MARAALATLISLTLSLASARVYTGTASGSFPFLGKFAFGPGGGNININVGDATTSLVVFDDAAWPSGCEDARGVTTDLQAGVPTSAAYPSALRPSFYFFSLASQAPVTCSSPIIATPYTLTATQANGDSLSYEEIGLPGVYGAFWAISLAQVVFFAWRLFFAPGRPDHVPVISRAVLGLFMLHTASDLAHLIEWATVARTGRGSVALAAAAGLLRLAAEATNWATAALVAVGYGISTAEAGWRADGLVWLRENARGALVLAALIVTYLVTALVYAVGGATATSRSAGESPWAAVVLIALTLGYVAWFFRRTRITLAAQVSAAKRTLLARLIACFAASMSVLPAAEFLGEGERRVGGAARARRGRASTSYPALRAKRSSPPPPRRRGDSAVRGAARRRRRRPLSPHGDQRAAHVHARPAALGGRLPHARHGAPRRRRPLARRGVRVQRGARGRAARRERAHLRQWLRRAAVSSGG